MRAVLLALVAAVLVLAACGESKEDKAMKSVCNARADISKQIDHLKSLTPTTATIEGVQSSLTSIGKDLSTIKDAQGDLTGDRHRGGHVQARDRQSGDQARPAGGGGEGVHGGFSAVSHGSVVGVRVHDAAHLEEVAFR